MAEVKNYAKVQEIAGKHLGKVGGEGYKDTYDPSLLVPIPRKLNREAYGIEEDSLPFKGYDVWNAYEVSAITEKGLPVSGMLKITCPADTEFHVESKSIKLYLNSFNMTPIGRNTKECIDIIEARVSRDLTELLGGHCSAKMFTSDFGHTHSFKGYAKLNAICDLDEIEFKSYKSDASQLEVDTINTGLQEITWQSDLLRSNCRVTNQPDWGDVFIRMKGYKIPTPESLARYIVSHRQVSHFHEEICEMMYTHLTEAFQPEELMVACLYTRRGGIDINPVRASHAYLIPPFFYDSNLRLEKTLRQ
jgi:7-cyano-7-deazaguanine reductase